MFEDELIPLFEECGTIWDLRLMMDPVHGYNRGYCFVTFVEKEGATAAVQKVGLFRPCGTSRSSIGYSAKKKIQELNY